MEVFRQLMYLKITRLFFLTLSKFSLKLRVLLRLVNQFNFLVRRLLRLEINKFSSINSQILLSLTLNRFSSLRIQLLPSLVFSLFSIRLIQSLSLMFSLFSFLQTKLLSSLEDSQSNSPQTQFLHNQIHSKSNFLLNPLSSQSLSKFNSLQTLLPKLLQTFKFQFNSQYTKANLLFLPKFLLQITLNQGALLLLPKMALFKIFYHLQCFLSFSLLSMVDSRLFHSL